jgi:hypothetical protein
MQVIEGKVHRVISHKPSPWDRAGGRYLIARLDSGTIVKGPMEGCAPNLPYRFFGELRPGKNGYAEAFHFASYAVLCDPGRRGIEQYLRGHVPGIGQVYARRIYETFGDDALAVLRVDPNRLTECGVPEHLIERAAKHFSDPHVIDPEAHAYLIDLLSPYKVPAAVVNKLVEAFKSDAPARLRERPYMLMQFPRVGWSTADQVALDACGYDPEGLERHAIAIEEALWAISLEGHTWAPQAEVEQVAYKLLSRRPREDSWRAVKEAGEVVCHGGFNPSWSLESLARAEERIADRLQLLLEAGCPLKFSIGGEELSPHQREAVRGFAEHSVFALIGPPGVGKAQPLDSLVLTPGGFEEMRSIRVGSIVSTPDGYAAKVIGVFPQGKKEVFRVNFDDGTCAECCAEHLWSVRDRDYRHRGVAFITVDTKTIADNLRSKDDHWRWSVPMSKPAFMLSQDLPIDPYLLGVLLGDGCFRRDSVYLSNPEPEIQETVRSLLPADVVMREIKAGIDFALTVPNGKGKNLLVANLRVLGLLGKKSTEKFIPDIYLSSPVHDRRMLLAGLLDTDGYVSRCNIEYSTSSWRLCEGVRLLVESLGGKVSVNSRIPVYTYKGERPHGALSFRVLVKLPGDVQPFRLTRKAEAYQPRTKYQPTRRIVGVESIGEAECQCIMVDHPDHLYITNDFIVTHNTWTTCAVVRSLYGMGIRSVLLVAPTGAAAKRSHAQFREHETCPPPCLTIHRALGIAPSFEPAGIPSDLARHGRGRDPFGFYHSDDQPLDCSVLIVEEASMCDAPLLASLLRAVRPGTRVLLVGDPDQLPPVGPGFPLRDLIDAGIPQARLTEVHRNCGRIVRACHAIREGRAPEPAADADIEAGDNWVHIEIDDPAQIATEIVGLVTGCKTMDRLWDIQVISPQKRTDHIGTYDLNALLSAALNPGHAKQTDDGPDPEFYVGDKIVRTANGLVDEMVLLGQVDPDPSWGDVAHLPDGRSEVIWQGRHFAVRETPVVNGDVGLVLDLIPTERRGMDVIVLFRDPDRLCTLPLGDCHLIRAWAITTHKMQGRGCPYVILPVHRSFYWDAKRGTGLACRENLYTRFSRASKLLVTVGQYAAIEAEVRRPTVTRRRTRLKSLIESDRG